MSDPVQFPHVCVDRYAPLSPPLPIGGDRLSALKAKLWPETQRVLRVRFLGGDARLHRRIAQTALRWSEHAAIRFVFDNSPHAPIRVGFTPGASWSYIGTDALDPLIGPDEPTINFGWLTPGSSNDELQRVVLHEFGHVLGLIHEHQSPAAVIPWNKPAVYAYFAGPPNHWTPAEVDRNLFERYEQEQTNTSAFDPASIMLYPIPPEFTDGKLVVGWNRDLSPVDRVHIGRIYPFDGRE